MYSKNQRTISPQYDSFILTKSAIGVKNKRFLLTFLAMRAVMMIEARFRT